jgi:hypothetical protein
MKQGGSMAQGRKRLARRMLGALLVVLIASGSASAEDLDAMKRQAQDLINQLQKELDAVRHERKQLQQEREAIKKQSPPPAATAAAPAPPATATETAETSRKVDVLSDEIAKLKENFVLPENKELKSEYGMGPAASKVYQISRGLSIGGYGEGFFSKVVENTSGGDDRADAERLVLYTGYKFTDRIILNAEVEFEHATTEETASSGPGEVAVEFAYLDFLGWKSLNARAGLLLVPIGFLNQMHEPTTYFGTHRPGVEQVIIPTTWSEIGAGLHGELLHPDLQYQAYLTTSLNARGFETEGIREGRQGGNDALAEDLAGALRLDYTPSQVPGLLVGASTFLGDTGQNQKFAGRDVDAFMNLTDIHAQYNAYGVWLRGLYAFGGLDNASEVSRQNEETVGKNFEGHYVEAAYDLMPWIRADWTRQALQPFFRYEHYDPQERVPSGFKRDRTKDTTSYTVGLSYKPHPQVVLKLDYRNFELAKGKRPDDINLGLGFVF